MRDTMVYVIATLTVKPEMKAEDGCISYELFESTTDPNRLVFVEQWQSAECLPLHSKSDHMKAFGRVAVKCFAAPVQVQIITPEKVEKR
jgi:quinol monooxygenase YgiN